MKEWFKKYLGWMGFGILMICTLIFIVAEFILNITLNVQKTQLSRYFIWTNFESIVKIFGVISCLNSMTKIT